MLIHLHVPDGKPGSCAAPVEVCFDISPDQSGAETAKELDLNSRQADFIRSAAIFDFLMNNVQ